VLTTIGAVGLSLCFVTTDFHLHEIYQEHIAAQLWRKPPKRLYQVEQCRECKIGRGASKGPNTRSIRLTTLGT